MVTVVNRGPHQSAVKECICRNCGATLQYVPRDVKEKTARDYGGGSDTYYFIECPACNEQVFVKRP